MSDSLPHSLRSDALENRERVLDAARDLFSERGLDVSMRDIARRAEVGPATLYRRFPTKEALVAEAFTDELEACEAIVRTACADDDAWRGFSSVITGIGELNARNQGFVDAFMTTFPDRFDFVGHRAGMLRSLADLARRAQAAGSLRADFVLDDLVIILVAGRGMRTIAADARVAAAKRFSALALDAFRAPDHASTPPAKQPANV